MGFNQAYTNLIKQLPPSLLEESFRRLTTRKRNPLTELEAYGIDPGIEDFLQHEIIVYNRKKERQRRSPPLKNLSYNTEASVKTHIDMVNQEIQTSDTNIHTCNHEVETNCRVKKELVNLSRQLLNYNGKTFDSLMQEITKQLEESQVEILKIGYLSVTYRVPDSCLISGTR